MTDDESHASYRPAVHAGGEPDAGADANTARGAGRPPEQLAFELVAADIFAPVAAPIDFRAAALARLNELWAMATGRLGRKRMTRPTLSFIRGRMHAGRAHYGELRIEINEDLLERYPESMLRETIAHELAHLLVQRVFGRRASAHGTQWQHLMREWFAVQPERTHHYDMSGISVRRQQRHNYACSCQTHELTTVRHKRARRGLEYRCVKCGNALAFVGAHRRSASPLDNA